MKDLSYLQVFSPKTLKEAKQILNKQFTAGDINKFLGKQIQIKHMRRIPKEKRRKYLANSHWGKRKP